MSHVISQDGTVIAYERSGTGPTVILVGGALGGRFGPELPTRLAPRFSVYRYDRRGRGGSGDTAPYAVEREVEDIDALITDAGGSARVYGISSGAVLALEAASRMPGRVTMLALYEPPFIVDSSRPPLPDDYVTHLDALIAAERRSDAVEYCMTAAMGIPEEYLAGMRGTPMWAGMEALAHTIAYDGRVMGDTMSGKPLPANAWATVTMPTLVITGDETEPFFVAGADALSTLLPDTRRKTLTGQGHNVEADALAPVLAEFFAG